MRRLLTIACLSTFVAACGGGGKTADVTPQPTNQPPTLVPPATVTGTMPSFTYTLPFGASGQLVFQASDPEGSTLAWQVSIDANLASTAGLSFPSPHTGTSMTMTLATAAAPIGVNMTILVEDARGGAAAIDLRLLRSGPPTLTSVTPSSAFVTQPQDVVIRGTGLQLAGAANTTIAFDGIAAVNRVIVSDVEARCSTPTTGALGPTVVAVANQFGAASLPGSAFRFHAWPVDLFANDTRIDAGAATGLEFARSGDVVHGVWLEGSALVHRGSADRGATWSTPTPLSAVEVVTEPQLLVDGDDVLVAWIGDGVAVWARRSEDGGASWAPAVRLDGAFATAVSSHVRIAQSGDRRYAAWVTGSVTAGNGRVVAVASSTAGATWTAPNPVTTSTGNQRSVELQCSGDIAWALFEDDRTAARGAYVARTLDTGSTWQPDERLNPATTAASEIRLCSDGQTRVYATWLQSGGLVLAASSDRGGTWGNTLIDLQTSGQGVVSAPFVTCDSARLHAIFVVAGTSIRTASFTPLGAAVQRATLDNTAPLSAQPRIASSGNYQFAVWREGDVVAGTARLQFATSVNGGAQFTPAAPFGDGSAVQAAPRLVVDGAHVVLGWIDSRAATAGVFVNGTEL